MTVSMRVMSAGTGYQYLLKSVAAGDGTGAHPPGVSSPVTPLLSAADVSLG